MLGVVLSGFPRGVISPVIMQALRFTPIRSDMCGVICVCVGGSGGCLGSGFEWIPRGIESASNFDMLLDPPPLGGMSGEWL